MPKENFLTKHESNCRILDQCYGLEEDKDGGMLKAINRTSRDRIEGTMAVEMNMGRGKVAMKNEDIIIKNNMKTTSMKITSRTMKINIIVMKITTSSSKEAKV